MAFVYCGGNGLALMPMSCSWDDSISSNRLFVWLSKSSISCSVPSVEVMEVDGPLHENYQYKKARKPGNAGCIGYYERWVKHLGPISSGLVYGRFSPVY